MIIRNGEKKFEKNFLFFQKGKKISNSARQKMES